MKGGVFELRNSGQPTHHQPDNDYSSEHPSSPTPNLPRLAHNLRPGASSVATQSSRLPTPRPTNATTKEVYMINVDNPAPKYFEVCINAGNHAVDHYELDISESTSDGALFVKIWEKYRMSRGFGLKRLFLRPRDVHFVMVIMPLNPRNNFHLANSNSFLLTPKYSTEQVSIRSLRNTRQRKS